METFVQLLYLSDDYKVRNIISYRFHQIQLHLHYTYLVLSLWEANENDNIELVVSTDGVVG